LLALERSFEPSPCAMQAHPYSTRLEVKDGAGLRWREAIPGDQEEQLPIGLGETRERAEHRRLVALRLHDVRLARRFTAEALPERVASSLPPTLGAESPARDTEQPGERVGWDLIEASPGDEEDVGDEVIDR
jgi:hypothetical protein